MKKTFWLAALSFLFSIIVCGMVSGDASHTDPVCPSLFSAQNGGR